VSLIFEQGTTGGFIGYRAAPAQPVAYPWGAQAVRAPAGGKPSTRVVLHALLAGGEARALSTVEPLFMMTFAANHEGSTSWPT
jgi:hypothetical protein